MRRILFALVLMVAPGVAWGEACTLSGTGSLTYTAPTTLAYSGTTSGCTLTLDDSLAITGTVSVPLNVGQAANYLTGGITVASGGSLTPAAGATIYSRGVVLYQSGASGTLNGNAMMVGAPRTITFPSETTITLDFSGCAKMNRSDTTRCTFPGIADDTTLWTLCNSASSCGAKTIHAATTNEAATLLYIDWMKTTPPENLFVGANGRAADTKPVYDPGLYLTVTAVDPANNTVTVTLPDVGTNGATYWYTVAEALSGTALTNIIGGTGWTVSGAGAYTNNENKRRYEIQIDEADTPFSADHEFEGYLICRTAGGYCARIIKTEINSHDPAGTAIGNGESVVVWNDPTGIVSAGDEMSIYYAKPTPEDTLVFVNPVKFDFAGGGSAAGGSLYVANGANVATTASPSSGVWVTGGWAGGRSGSGTEYGGVDLANETLGTAIDLWLVERTEGCPVYVVCAIDSLTHIYPADALTLSSDTDDIGKSGLYAQRVTTRYPQVAQTVWDNGSSFYHSPAGITPVERTGNDRNVIPWTDNGMRKIRIEGYGYGLAGARSGIIRSCREGLWIQDMLILHGRSARPATTAARGDDTFEFQAAGAGCDVDKLASIASNNAGSLVARSMREGQTYYTSVVAIGNAGRISRTYPASADRSTYWHINGIYLQAQDGGGQSQYYARGYTKFVNWITDGETNGFHNAYGSLADWYVDETNLPSGEICENTVGFYAVGGYTGYGVLGSTNTASEGSCLSTDAVRWLDVYLTALGTQNNYQRVSAGSGLIYTAKSQAPASITLDGWMISSKRDNVTSLLDARNAVAGTWVLPLLSYKNLSMISGNTAGYPTLFHSLVTATVPNIAKFTATNVFWAQPNANAMQAYVGSNIAYTTCADGGGGTHICSNAAGENEIYTGINKYLGTSGDYATGLALTPLTWSADEAGTDDVRSAAPRYAGIIVYDWPFAWATMDPVPGYRRTTPRNEFIPARLKARMVGGGGGGGWLPRAF